MDSGRITLPVRGEVAERLNAAVSKTVVPSGTGSSNLPLSAIKRSQPSSSSRVFRSASAPSVLFMKASASLAKMEFLYCV